MAFKGKGFSLTTPDLRGTAPVSGPPAAVTLAACQSLRCDPLLVRVPVQLAWAKLARTHVHKRGTTGDQNLSSTPAMTHFYILLQSKSVFRVAVASPTKQLKLGFTRSHQQ